MPSNPSSSIFPNDKPSQTLTVTYKTHAMRPLPRPWLILPHAFTLPIFLLPPLSPPNTNLSYTLISLTSDLTLSLFHHHFYPTSHQPSFSPTPHYDVYCHFLTPDLSLSYLPCIHFIPQPWPTQKIAQSLWIGFSKLTSISPTIKFLGKIVSLWRPFSCSMMHQVGLSGCTTTTNSLTGSFLLELWNSVLAHPHLRTTKLSFLNLDKQVRFLITRL